MPVDGQTRASVLDFCSLSHSRVRVYMFVSFARAYEHTLSLCHAAGIGLFSSRSGSRLLSFALFCSLLLSLAL